MKLGEQMSVIFIGICGGSASGKTTLATAIKNRFLGYVNVISMDDYYKDNSHLTSEAKAQLNFDHPDAFDSVLLAEHLGLLKAGVEVLTPQYSFYEQTRLPKGVSITPLNFVILEGLYVLYFEAIRNLLDMSIFLETSECVRYSRILERDSTTRNISIELVQELFYRDIKPMHERYVEPQSRFADLIINGDNPKRALKIALKLIVNLEKGNET